MCSKQITALRFALPEESLFPCRQSVKRLTQALARFAARSMRSNATLGAALSNFERLSDRRGFAKTPSAQKMQHESPAKKFSALSGRFSPFLAGSDMLRL